jgi:hypothetical protein
MPLLIHDFIEEREGNIVFFILMPLFNTLHLGSGHSIKHLLGGVTLFYALKLIAS